MFKIHILLFERCRYSANVKRIVLINFYHFITYIIEIDIVRNSERSTCK